MERRTTPLPEPPDRAPYIRVRAGGDVLVLRVPSLHRAAELARAIGQQDVAALTKVLAGNSPISALTAAGPTVLEALGALVGASWADPELELETPQPRDWSPECSRAYGREVFEELHEAGWPLSRVLAAALAVLRELVEASRIETEVQEMAAFFGVRTVVSSGGQPTSTPAGPESPSAEASQP